MVTNIHSREYPVDTARLAALLDKLGTAEDRLWPSHRWPPMRFDGPLRPGAAGGHGPIRYVVDSFDPGRSLRFRFTAPEGFIGWHGFDIEAVGEGRSRLSHTIQADVKGGMRLTWPLALRWLHDACVEDALDNAARALGEPLPQRRHSLAVRILRRLGRRA
ncbi:MAG: SRPBCC family protein [Holophagaceae bacterium]|nr:SRPBCC family protein [Holophagaceae bacterium]